MTTLTINIPDGSTDVISDISIIVKKIGGKMSVVLDDGLSDEEFKNLNDAYKEALLIKDHKVKSVPASQIWDE